MRRFIVAATLVLLAGTASCDCTSETAGVDQNAFPGGDGDVALDSLGGDDTTAPGDASGGVDTPGAGDSGHDTNHDAGDGGSGEVDDGCGAYQALCDGVCIPVSQDPDNCGGCGVVCEATEACSGGRCVGAGECSPGLSTCDRRCVDTFWDNDHCGRCDNACGEGRGCLDEACVDLVALGEDPAFCEGGGPPIDFGAEVPEGSRCAGNLAEFTFRWGLCSCEGITTNNPFTIDAYDSNLGPYTPGGPGGGAGTNGAVNSNELVSVTGTLWASGTGGIRVNDDAVVGQRLYSGGRLNINGDISVGSDAYVVGNIGVGALEVGGTLHVRPESTLNGTITAQNQVEADVEVGRACTACEPDERIPVGDIVAARRGAANDNALIGLDPDLLSNSAGNLRLELPCGHYYLSEISTNGPTTIVARGNTALYIDGNISANNELTITLAPNAQFDVFVAGNVTINNPFRLGSPNYPALMRLYVGGDSGFRSNNEIQVGGYIYAVPGGFESNNEIEIYGGLYAQDFDSNNEVGIHYDRGVTRVGRSCPDDDPGDPTGGDPDAGPGPDGGAPDTGAPDGGTTDAGNGGDPDPVCRSTDSACTADSDCCSPLLCNNGVCSLLTCQPTFDTCTQNSECCSNLCAISGGSTSGFCIVN